MSVNLMKGYDMGLNYIIQGDTMKRDVFDAKRMWNVSLVIAILIAAIFALCNLEMTSNYFINAFLK